MVSAPLWCKFFEKREAGASLFFYFEKKSFRAILLYMIYQIKSAIKKILPLWVFSTYHWVLGFFGALCFWFPSRKLLVIGVTGTTGKSSTAFFLAKIFEEAGYKVGMASTIFFKIGEEELLNNKKMTMIGRFQLQKFLCQMVKAKCHIAIVETTSEGIKQFRHRWINYDIVLFTNLSPEHIEAHGSFIKYREAKGKLFSHLARGRKKILPFFGRKFFPKTAVINMDDEHAEFFLSIPVERTYGYTMKDKHLCELIANECRMVVSDHIQFFHKNIREARAEFTIGNVPFSLSLFGGEHHVANSLAAVGTALAVGVDLFSASNALKKIVSIPGRLERIVEGQNFEVIVDYAFEPKAMNALYKAIESLEEKPRRIIHVAGGTGGGRDKSRRSIIGGFIGKHADIFIVTNEDPYDEDPQKIIAEVAGGAKKVGLKEDKNLFLILDRREAIQKALQLVEKNDLVLITGKGSEQAIVEKGKLIPWDDRKVVREELAKLQEIE